MEFEPIEEELERYLSDLIAAQDEATGVGVGIISKLSGM